MGDQAEKLAEDKHRKICQFYGVDLLAAEQDPDLLFLAILEYEKKINW